MCENYLVQLIESQTRSLNGCVPRSGKRYALNDPKHSQYDVTQDQERNKGLQRPDGGFADGDTQDKQTDRHLGEHESCKGLHPLSVRVFLKLAKLVLTEVGFVPPESVVDFYDDQGHPDGDPELYAGSTAG